MAEWLKAHAWKLTPAARADAHRIPPTHFRSTTSPYNDVRRRVPVNHGVDPGVRGVCDTVLTQFADSLTPYTSMFLRTHRWERTATESSSSRVDLVSPSYRGHQISQKRKRVRTSSSTLDAS